MKPYKVTEETPVCLNIRLREKEHTIGCVGIVHLLMTCCVAIVDVKLLFILGFVLILIIVWLAIISFLTRDDWVFNKEKRTVIHKTMNVFRQSVVRQEYNLRDIQHAFIDEVEDDETSGIFYKHLALKLASGETIRLMNHNLFHEEDLQELMDRINAWMKSGGV